MANAVLVFEPMKCLFDIDIRLTLVVYVFEIIVNHKRHIYSRQTKHFKMFHQTEKLSNYRLKTDH